MSLEINNAQRLSVASLAAALPVPDSIDLQVQSLVNRALGHITESPPARPHNVTHGSYGAMRPIGWGLGRLPPRVLFPDPEINNAPPGHG